VAGAYVNYGVALQWLGRFQDAIAAFDRALQLDSDCVDAHWNSALLRLMHGDYETGWKQYEWRWRKPDFNQVGRPGGPMWLGQTPLEGIRLYLVNEQGFGDTLQMMRYAALARERGATVLLNVDPALKELAATVPGVARVVSGGDPVAYDMWTPMMSLPLAFGTTLETVPNKVPYISADPAKVAAWRERLGETRRPRVGLAWSGRAAHANDRNRSLRLAELVPLLDADAEFISLQREYREADRPLLADLPIRDVSEQLTNFSDTAALIEILDLVIAVDTSVAHLAGALARPFCVMIAYVPDFRWGLTGDTTPWYPTAKLLRQPRPGDWGSVIDRARAEIAALKA
jgi:tetratricopeptide (TPR) repeat protein